MRSTSTSPFKHLVLAGLLASIGLAASAQTAAPAAPGTPPAPMADKAGPPTARPGERMGRHDPAKMQEHMAKRAAELKAKLKLTPAQEPAWTTFTTSMQPPAPHARMERGDMAKLTTPERIDKMRAMRAQRDAEMDKRGDAVKAFYAVLTPEQQKVFDANAMMHRPGGRDGHWGRGGPDGRPHGGPEAQPKG
ncbi:hypothetical protein RD110_00270 [Rhodoferax koreense]|uniref:LTXXQ motif family protein n=1 Tax=Rhodoferax koreensis TaxID=1842727 RepID=A0A1P8JQ27_9BURK|nr:Spy/CpxP family protein refolding chaperone [Rhodoferax koreense]APW35841.1 hypothetical protein RD110_00270 [Rhodoferax koreense]